MIEGAKQYVDKKIIWQGRKIVIVDYLSCYDGDFFEYCFIDDDYREVHKISIFDNEFVKILSNNFIL